MLCKCNNSQNILAIIRESRSPAIALSICWQSWFNFSLRKILLKTKILVDKTYSQNSSAGCGPLFAAVQFSFRSELSLAKFSSTWLLLVAQDGDVTFAAVELSSKNRATVLSRFHKYRFWNMSRIYSVEFSTIDCLLLNLCSIPSLHIRQHIFGSCWYETCKFL